jgi:hypothetical protein
MAVHVDEVEVVADDRATGKQRSESPDAPHAATFGPQLTQEIVRTVALQRSRNLRLRAD